MTVRYKTEGFVFRKEDRFDADRNFFLFTKDFGRVELLGRAIRKISSKLKGGIDLFSLSKIEFIQGKNKKTLTDAVFFKNFNSIFENPEKFKTALFISNLLDDLIKGQEPDRHIFDLVKETLIKLNSSGSFKLFHFYFFWNLASLLGYKPELSHCLACSQKLRQEILYFSSNRGGVVCYKCATRLRRGLSEQGAQRNLVKVHPDFIKVLRLILKKDLETLSKLKIEDNIEKLLKDISADYKNNIVT